MVHVYPRNGVLNGIVAPFLGAFVLFAAFFVKSVVPSAISGGDTTGYQTFDVNVHADVIRLVPKFTRYDEMIGISEVCM